MSSDPRKLPVEEQKLQSKILLEHDDEQDALMDVDEDLPLSSNIDNQYDESSSSQSSLLPIKIISPSPYPAHNTANSRFRNAWQRIQSSPETDTEAWLAIITEASTCYKAIETNLSSIENAPKLDFIESCYGALLHYFPYSRIHVVAIAEILLAQVNIHSTRSRGCAHKLNRLFLHYLGVRIQRNQMDSHSGQAEENISKIPMCTWVAELWMLYIRHSENVARSQAITTKPPEERPAFIRDAVVAAYEEATTHAGDGIHNHIIWKAYLEFVQSWTVADGANSDHALAQKQMLHLRSVYQRLVTFPMTGLDQLWNAYEAFEKAQSEVLAAALIPELAPKYQHARSVYLERNRVYGIADLRLDDLTPVLETTDIEELEILKNWRTCWAYERTNPERLEPRPFSMRIRKYFSMGLCVLTKFPEAWHSWSVWEHVVNKNTDMAIKVLQLAQSHIPDSTFLAHAEAQLVNSPETVLQNFLRRSPNTLGFVLYERYVRAKHGIDAARTVFAQARRTLSLPPTSITKTAVETIQNESTETTTAEVNDSSVSNESKQKRWMVTNRLDPNVGINPEPLTNGNKKAAVVENPGQSIATSTNPITWHLYASHALIEHRWNREPNVAARIYELGLRKHKSFLTTPAYIKLYACLLLELNDTMNLRALLSRAIAACQAEDKKDALASLWDMTLHIESLLGMGDEKLLETERHRHEAVMGADIEDVATGGLAGGSDATLIGAQKSTISEQLIRVEGYDVSSRIVNGMSRTVDLLGIMGLLGSIDDFSASNGGKFSDLDFSGGKSDALYQKRLRFQRMAESGLSIDGTAEAGGTSKLVSARERLQQSNPIPAGSGGTAIMLAIQQSPDWLRPLLLLLPASKSRAHMVAKAAPHMVEMAFTVLRQNELPAERPADSATSGLKRRSLNNDSSSDEEDGNKGTGYGNAFRNRQRERMTA